MARRQSRIQQLSLDETNGTLEWFFDGQRVRPTGYDFGAAFVDSVYDRVFALENSFPKRRHVYSRLHVYSAEGKEIAVLGPPDEFQFYYLTSYSTVGVAVVCVAREPVDGWQDWHFGFDPKTKTLFRIAPAR
jgi:hypothetical protein